VSLNERLVLQSAAKNYTSDTLNSISQVSDSVNSPFTAACRESKTEHSHIKNHRRIFFPFSVGHRPRTRYSERENSTIRGRLALKHDQHLTVRNQHQHQQELAAAEVEHSTSTGNGYGRHNVKRNSSEITRAGDGVSGLH
jgi:hypothetical protein